MELEITLLASGATLQRAVHFEFADDLVQAHIGLETVWEVYLTVGALLGSKLPEAALADDGAALLAVEGRVWQFEADNALQLLEAQLLRDKVGYLLLDRGGSRLTMLDLLVELPFILRHVIIVLMAQMSTKRVS